MKNNIIILDCETGGLKKELHPITQVGLVVIEPKNFAILDQYETFIQPYDDLIITKEAMEASRVSMEEINAGIPHKKAVAKLIEIFRKYTPPNSKGAKPILVGHNFKFDIGFLDNLFASVSKDVFDFVDEQWMCTMKLMQLYERKDKTNLSYNLSSCCERFGIKLKSAHGALPDCIATRDLFKAMMVGLQPNASKVIESNAEETVKSRSFFELP